MTKVSPQIVAGLTLVLLLTGFVFVVFSGATFSILPPATRGPSDSEVKAAFRANPRAFEQLGDLVSKEAGHRIYLDSLPHPGLSKSQNEKYQELLSEVSCIGVYRHSDGQEIVLHSSGNVAESYSVAIVRRDDPPDPETVVADTMSTTVSDNTVAFSHIIGDWYVMREHD